MRLLVDSCWGSRESEHVDEWEALSEAHEVLRGLYPLSVRRERLLQDLSGSVRWSGPPVAVRDAVLDVTIRIR